MVVKNTFKIFSLKVFLFLVLLSFLPSCTKKNIELKSPCVAIDVTIDNGTEHNPCGKRFPVNANNMLG